MKTKLLLGVAFLTAILPAQTFDAATIKLNTTCGNGRGGRGPMGPGRLSMGCTTVQNLIQLAYGNFANGATPNPRRLQVIGAPKWLESEQYDLEAKADGATGLMQMAGPLLRALLEDRLKLKVQKETRDLPVYLLTVAKTGSKLQAVKDGSCTPIDLNHLSSGPPVPGQTPTCGRATSHRNGSNLVMEINGMSLADFTGQILSGALDRPVIDKTGLAGLFNYHLEYAPDIAASTETSGPSIFTAVQDELGLKLSPDTGPVEVLVVDHVERPSEN